MVEVTAIAPPTPIVGGVPLWWGFRAKVDGQLAPNVNCKSKMHKTAATTSARWVSIFHIRFPLPGDRQAALWLVLRRIGPHRRPAAEFTGRAGSALGVLYCVMYRVLYWQVLSLRLVRCTGAAEGAEAWLSPALREIQGWVAQSGWRRPARLFPLPQRPDKVS